MGYYSLHSTCVPSPMRPRDTLILLGTLAVCAAAGLVWMTQDTYAVELPPSPAAAAAPAAANGPVGDVGVAEASAVSGDHAIPVAATADANGPARTDTRGWTSGIVRGDIQLAVSVLDRLQSITVIVEEARSAIAADGSFHNPHRLVAPVRRDAGTPTFEVRDVPFSEYPYVVSVYSPGLNGTRRTVTIDEHTPLVDDVVLTITPGAPYSILLRDQDSAPYAGLDVLLQPVGEPLGRRADKRTSDNFGSVVFEDVLAGDYRIVVTLNGQQLGEPQALTVPAGAVNFQSARAQSQGYTVVIPRGMPLEVAISDTAGYGVADAKVTATAADRLKLTVLEAVSGYSGKAEFAHLTPGSWQLDIEKDGYQRSHRMVTITAGQTPDPQAVRLVRLRR